jgi:predicted Holliday junction resolvase-like endonuclease
MNILVPIPLSLIIVIAIVVIVVCYAAYLIGELVGTKVTADKFPDAKKEAVQRSRSVLGGQFAEQLAPYLPDFPFRPNETKFIGSPVDFIVFEGMDEKNITDVFFVEVKSGNARLNSNQKNLKDAIDNKRVQWKEYKIPEDITKKPTEANALN